jgi:kynureninase
VTPAPLARDAFRTGPEAYLAGNSLGLQPIAARAAIERRLEEWATLGVEGWFEAGWLEVSRAMAPALARVVGARPDEVAVMNTLSVNLHLLLAALYRPSATRYRIVIDADAFPSDSHVVASHVAWHGLDPADAVVRDAEAIDESVAVVLRAGVSYLSGERADVRAATGRAHAAGALVIWDLAHAAGNVPLAMHDDDVDAAAWCSYKYLNGGPGAPGGVFVHQRHHAVPRLAGWWGVDPSTRFVMASEFVARAGAEGFALSTPSVLAYAPVAASLELFDQFGMASLRATSVALTAHLESLLDEVATRRPLRITTPRDPERRGCQLSLSVPAARAVAGRLRAEHGVVCDFREPDVLRFAPVPLYTSAQDCARAAAALDAVLGPTAG